MNIWLCVILLVQARFEVMRSLPLDSYNGLSRKSANFEAVSRFTGCRGGRKLPWCKGTP